MRICDWRSDVCSSDLATSTRVSEAWVWTDRDRYPGGISGGDVDSLGGDCREKVDLFLGDAIGRQEIHHTAERAQQRSALHRVLIDLQAATLLPGIGRADRQSVV